MSFIDYMIIFLFHIIIPIGFIIELWRAKFKSKFSWLLSMLLYSLFIILYFLIGAWDILGYYIRYVLVVLLVIAIVFSWLRVKSLPNRLSTEKLLGFRNIFIYLAISVFLFGGFSILMSFTDRHHPLHLTFPLQDGTYYIGQGGNTGFLNHHDNVPQQYAYDIVKLNTYGSRATGIFPSELEKYEIFGDTLYSPCNGVVTDMQNTLPDLTPLQMDSKKPYGNYIGMQCEGSQATVYLAHMQQDSIQVHIGDQVMLGEIIGKVGNSGNTTEPHLHIHAEENGIGIQIQFDGESPIRNSLIKR
ncbi:peptidoglycan DD-metalloendopeptidase family protein [Virgibacillus soli]|uniref:peptidoglycan DD-metalloendopeptidase family protein n=1 Tax=Paracerasibacillus soli TaxID=480284 RepID=UPI0035E9E0C5